MNQGETYCETDSGRHRLTKRDLSLAVIEQGVRDYIEVMKPAELREWAREVQESAELWLFSDKRTPMSFLWYCKELGIEDPDAIRDEALQQRREVDERRAVRKELARKKRK